MTTHPKLYKISEAGSKDSSPEVGDWPFGLMGKPHKALRHQNRPGQGLLQAPTSSIAVSWLAGLDVYALFSMASRRLRLNQGGRE